MSPARDMAENLEALFTALGAVDQVNAIGVVSTTNGTTQLPDPTVQAINSATLGASGQTFALPAPGVGKRLRLLLTQDSTGSRTAVLATNGAAGGGSLVWVGHSAPTLTTTGGRTDILTFESYDGTTWIGNSALNAG